MRENVSQVWLLSTFLVRLNHRDLQNGKNTLLSFFSPKTSTPEWVISDFVSWDKKKMLIHKTSLKVSIVETKEWESIFQPVWAACNPTCLSLIAEIEVQ